MALRTAGPVSRSRCTSCARALGFEDWTAGKGRCSSCVARGEFAPPGGRIHTRTPNAAPAAAAVSGYRAYQRMVDEAPGDLIAELERALVEEEHERTTAASRASESMLKGVAEDLALGRSKGELQWAFMGFAGGFAANVALMKYVQLATGATMDAVLAPMFLGGLMTGATCAVIAWGVVKLRER